MSRRLQDKAHRDRAAAHNEIWVPKVTEALTQLGLTVTPSIGNFVLIHLPDEKGRRAAEADAFLLKRGIVLRRMEAYGLPNALRMTIGSAEANEATVAAFAAFLGGASVTKPIFPRLALIGIGLIGASIALAARRASAAGHIAISSRTPETLKRAEELGLGDSYHADRR